MTRLVFTTNLHKIIISPVVRGSEERRTWSSSRTDFLFAQRLKTLKNNLTRWSNVRGSKTGHVRYGSMMIDDDPLEKHSTPRL